MSGAREDEHRGVGMESWSFQSPLCSPSLPHDAVPGLVGLRDNITFSHLLRMPSLPGACLRDAS